MEGARSAAAGRRSGALAGGLRGAPHQGTRGKAVREDRSEEGIALRVHAARGSADHAHRADAAHQHRDDVVRGGRCGRQHDRRHADAVDAVRHVLRLEGPGFSLQQPPAIESPDRGRLWQPGAADAVEHVRRTDARVREDCVGRGGAAPGRRLRRQRVDSGVGLQHHHRRDRRQAGRAGGHRGAAVPARPRSGRSARERRARRDRRSIPAGAAPGSDRARPQVPEDWAQRGSAIRLRRRDHPGRPQSQGRRWRGTAPVARRRPIHAWRIHNRTTMIDPGKKAPAFSLPDQAGKTHNLADYAGQPVVLYFYPKDDTPGCTTESCAFQDNLPKFKKGKAAVLGVSVLDSKSKAKFADKYGLKFPLLADEDHAVIEKYGVWQEKSMYGKKYMGVARTTYLIGPDGKVVKRWDGVKVDGHAEEVLAAVQQL